MSDPKTPVKPVVMKIDWKGDQSFDTSKPDGPVAQIDGKGKYGQSPVDALLAAVGACTAIDVVEILAKRRTPAKSMQIEMVGERVEEMPRRYKHITLKFRITGAGIERDQALRAIDLSVTKYCSVRASLLEQIIVDWELELSDS